MSFTCQAGLLVKNDRKCEHCGATERDTCGRLHIVMQQTIDDLLTALREVDRWALVIDSAIRNDAPSDHASIVTVMKCVQAAIIKAAAPAATLGDAVRAARGGAGTHREEGVCLMILHSWHPIKSEGVDRCKYITQGVEAFTVGLNGVRTVRMCDGSLWTFSPSDRFRLFTDTGKLVDEDYGAHWANNSPHVSWPGEWGPR